MSFRINHRPSYAMLEVDLAPGEILVTESGAMIAKSTQVKIDPQLTVNPNASGMDKFKAITIATIRKFVGGESFFVSHFTTTTPGKVWVAPNLTGDIAHRSLNNSTLFISALSYLASRGNLDVKPQWGGLKGLLAKEGMFYLRCQGTGDIWFNSFGGIEEIEVNGEYIVDNGHIAGWDASLTFSIVKSGSGFISSMTSGEGMVCKFKGQGKVFIQTRNLPAFGDWIGDFY